jgi:K+-sensing histidine kinase KdpD
LLFFIFIGLFPPLAIGVAVLRYRLWDIDLLIRRTLVYSILTVILTLIYFGSVVSLQELSQLITRQQESPVATVLSTLAIAALFSPLRRRIQARVDHRFYRQKYNAEQVLANFSTTLREEVNLEQLTDSILEVVRETMQPIHVSLWLSQASSPKSRAAPGERPAR